MSELGAFLVVYEQAGDVVVANEHDMPSVDARFTRWVKEGVDDVLHLTLASGDPYTTTASNIRAFRLSTPEGRAAAVKHNRLEDLETKDHRQAAGYSFTEIEALEAEE